MKRLRKMFLGLLSWFIVAAVLTAIIWFFGTVLLSYTFAYRDVFWPLFFWVGGFTVAFDSVFSSWAKEYNNHLMKGILKRRAFDAACDNVKFRPPKVILKLMEPVLYKMRRYFSR